MASYKIKVNCHKIIHTNKEAMVVSRSARTLVLYSLLEYYIVDILYILK